MRLPMAIRNRKLSSAALDCCLKHAQVSTFQLQNELAQRSKYNECLTAWCGWFGVMIIIIKELLNESCASS